MANPQFQRLKALASTPQALEDTISYVSQNLKRFIRRQERVLLCFPNHDPGSVGDILEKAVRACEAIPICWGPDYRWKALLRQAFVCRATTVIGPPLLVLGLAKLAKNTSTPLYIRNVVTAGYPCLDWMIDGITKTLDCNPWGVFGFPVGSIVGGFSCGCSRGVHIRQDAYDVRILDEEGNPVPDGTSGYINLISRQDPTAVYRMRETARLERAKCACGQETPRLMDFHPGKNVDPALEKLGEELHSWTSVLDCTLKKGPCGLEMELVVFPGEKLPQLPACARMVLRNWDPARDMPLWWGPVEENR